MSMDKYTAPNVAEGIELREVTSGYKIGICDDNREFSEYMKKLLLESCPVPAEVFLYSSGEELAEDIEQKHHLIVMDIGLGGMDGFNTSKLLREKNPDAFLVFCSGEYEPRPEYFEVTALRYLKKDYPEERLKKELSFACERMVQRFGQEFLLAKGSDGGVRRIQVKDVVYISKTKRGSVLHVAGEQPEAGGYVCKKHLRELYAELENKDFGWPHDSYIVNLRFVKDFKARTFTLKTGEIMNISRAYHRTFIDKLVRYWEGKYE